MELRESEASHPPEEVAPRVVATLGAANAERSHNGGACLPRGPSELRVHEVEGVAKASQTTASVTIGGKGAAGVVLGHIGYCRRSTLEQRRRQRLVPQGKRWLFMPGAVPLEGQCTGLARALAILIKLGVSEACNHRQLLCRGMAFV